MIPLLVLGTGWVGRQLVAAVPGAVGTTRDGRDGTLRFSLGEDPARLPRARAVAWTLPLAETSAALPLLDAFGGAQHLVLGTTGAWGDGGTVDEASLLNTAPRTLAEEALRARGAEVFRLAGLWGHGRLPWNWVRDGRITDGNRCVNLVHGDDVVAVLLRALQHPQPGRHLVVSDGHPHRWHELVDACIADGRLPAGTRLPDGPGVSKQLRIGALRRFMGPHAFAVPRSTGAERVHAAVAHARQHLSALDAWSRTPAEDAVLDAHATDTAAQALEQLLEHLQEALALALPGDLAGLADALNHADRHGLVRGGDVPVLHALVRLRRAGADGYSGVDVETFHRGVRAAHPALAHVLAMLEAVPGRVVRG